MYVSDQWIAPPICSLVDSLGIYFEQQNTFGGTCLYDEFYVVHLLEVRMYAGQAYKNMIIYPKYISFCESYHI
jgi:hypothetical protein